MATVKEVVHGALEEIFQTRGNEPIRPHAGEVAKIGLNDMMTMLDAKGINLGFTVVSNMGETVTVPDGAIAGIKANLAIFVASKFGAEVSPALMKKAKDGMSAMRNLVVTPIEREYPDILPMGSGNSGAYSDTFYTESLADIATETGGSIALEDDTEEA